MFYTNPSILLMLSSLILLITAWSTWPIVSLRWVTARIETNSTRRQH